MVQTWIFNEIRKHNFQKYALLIQRIFGQMINYNYFRDLQNGNLIMQRSHSVIYMFFFLAFTLSCQKEDHINLLIFSGSNNHDWKSTTQLLKNIYSESGLFSVSVTEQPDTIKANDLKAFDVIVSNWNSWPENTIRLPEQTESALLDFIDQGGGWVTFHASSSAFYDWPEFKKISTAAWVDSTWHGTNSATKVSLSPSFHLVTEGMSDFYIYDELWVNAEINEQFEILGTASNKNLVEQGIENQPAIIVMEYGKGRVFHTILGHDTRAMRNIGFETLLLRGTEWAAKGRVTQKIPQELNKKENPQGEYTWMKTDTSFALLQGQYLVWKYNFNEYHGKAFFHPVYVGKNNMTCLSPEDHPWHVGQWFSWKYLNGINYWEYQNGTYQAEGVTEINNIEIELHDDFSATIELKIVYHPIDGENVMAESRVIKVLPPDKNGYVSMKYHFEFEAVADTLDINRTPILGEANGMSWGGYSGLSIRFNQSFMDSQFLSSWGEVDEINGHAGEWLYMGFTGLDGNQVGSQIMISPGSQRERGAWYTVNTNDLPFYYFSPAYIYHKPLLLLKGEKLSLDYRINHIPGKVDQILLDKEFHNYLYLLDYDKN